MTEHYTRNTESVTAWCNQCARDTQHAVSDGRRGRCLEHAASEYSKKQLAERARRDEEAERQRQQPGLF
jgi:hypothetical protein